MTPDNLSVRQDREDYRGFLFVGSQHISCVTSHVLPPYSVVTLGLISFILYLYFQNTSALQFELFHLVFPVIVLASD